MAAVRERASAALPIRPRGADPAVRRAFARAAPRHHKAFPCYCGRVDLTSPGERRFRRLRAGRQGWPPNFTVSGRSEQMFSSPVRLSALIEADGSAAGRTSVTDLPVPPPGAAATSAAGRL